MPAVGLLTSFQSLPFINIYSSSSTKNNILELKKQKKKKILCELNLVITCATGPQGRECVSSIWAVRPLAASPSLALTHCCLPVDWATKFSAFLLAVEQQHCTALCRWKFREEGGGGRTLFLALKPECECL